MPADDAIDHRQAQPCPFVRALRREKRFKNPRYHLGYHAHPRIPDHQTQVGPGQKQRGGDRAVQGEIRLIQMYLQHAACGTHGIGGVARQIHEHLLELRGIRQHGAGRRIEEGTNVDGRQCHRTQKRSVS